MRSLHGGKWGGTGLTLFHTLNMGGGGWPILSCVLARCPIILVSVFLCLFRNCGCPVLALFAGAGTRAAGDSGIFTPLLKFASEIWPGRNAFLPGFSGFSYARGFCRTRQSCCHHELFNQPLTKPNSSCTIIATLLGLLRRLFPSRR